MASRSSPPWRKRRRRRRRQWPPLGRPCRPRRDNAQSSPEPRVSACDWSHSTTTWSRLHRLPHAHGDDGDPARRRHHIDNAFHRPGFRRFETLHRGAEERRINHDRREAAGLADVNGELLAALRLRREIIRGNVSLPIYFQSLGYLSGIRQARLAGGGGRHLAIARRLAGGVAQHALAGRNLGRGNAPSGGGGGDQHGARRRPGAAITLPGQGDAGGAAGELRFPPAARLP